MKVNAQTAARIVRWAVLAASTLFFLFFSRFISEHAICPIGGFELFFNGVFASGFSVAGLFSGMVLIFLIMSVLSILFRRAYCGYICPLGALQELFERIGKLVLPKKLRGLKVPARIDGALRWVKYAVLALFLAGAGVWGGHWMIKGDPFIAFMSLPNGIGAALERNPSSLAFLAAILAFAFFLGRGFCKYLCPAGAWYALLSKISPNKIVRDETKCAGCGLCSQACPMNIDVANLKKVASAECLGCRECVNACPAQGALSAPVGKFDVPATIVPLAAAAVFSGSVYAASISMPPRGERPQGPNGEQPQGSGGEQGQKVRHGNPNYKGSKNVSFGGCSSCVGCGLCGSV